MLTQKLLRIEETTVQEIEKLAQKLSEKEYISFSALVRKLIRLGLDNMEITKKSWNVKIVPPTDEDLAEANLCQIPDHLKPLFERIITKARSSTKNEL